VRQVFGQYLAQVVLIGDQQPVEELPAQGEKWPWQRGEGDPRRWRLALPAQFWAPG
jgi:hypothetical protein